MAHWKQEAVVPWQSPGVVVDEVLEDHVQTEVFEEFQV